MVCSIWNTKLVWFQNTRGQAKEEFGYEYPRSYKYIYIHITELEAVVILVTQDARGCFHWVPERGEEPSLTVNVLLVSWDMGRSESLIQLVFRATLSNSFEVIHYALFGFMSQNHNKIRPVFPNAFYCFILMREMFNLHFISSQSWQWKQVPL